jgi:hypothetical protein
MSIIIIMTLMALFWGYLIATSIAPAISSYRKESKAITAAMSADLELYDEEGFRKQYDPHYARDLEEKEGLKVVTQCEDINCTKCYWKARMLNDVDHSVFPGGSVILRKRQDWIKAQLDGLSDDLYELMYEDWRADMAPEITEHWNLVRRNRDEKMKRKEEEFYNTPYDLIQLYKAQGREYSRSANSWSSPKGNKQLGTSDAALTVTARNKKYWREKHPDYAPINPKPVGNQTVGPDTVINMEVTEVYDMEKNQVNRIMTTYFASGEMVVKSEPITYESWKHGRRNK